MNSTIDPLQQRKLNALKRLKAIKDANGAAFFKPFPKQDLFMLQETTSVDTSKQATALANPPAEPQKTMLGRAEKGLGIRSVILGEQ